VCGYAAAPLCHCSPYHNATLACTVVSSGRAHTVLVHTTHTAPYHHTLLNHLCSSVIIMRRAGSSGRPPELCIGLVLLLNILCLGGGELLTASSNESTASAKTASWCTSLAYTLFAGAAVATLALDCLCPEPAHSNGSSSNGRSSNGHNGSSSSNASFKMPLLPYLPAVGILTGSVLLAQVNAPSLKDSAVSFVLVLALYGLYGASRSVGNRTYWGKHAGESRGLLENKYSSAQQDPGYYSFESTGSLR
jgi:C-terminus of AA_permease